MATVTSLTEDKINELMAGWESVAFDQQEHDALLSQLKIDLEANDARLTEFSDITLPQLQADLAAGSIKVSELNDTTIPNLQATLDQHALNLTNLNDVDIPALNTQLDSNSSWILEFDEITVPALNARLDANDASLADLNNVQLPALDTRLTQVESSTGFDPAPLQAEIDALEAKFPITGPDIAANEITANHILADTITAAQIAAGTITALEIAADTITANEIASGTITAAEIFANTITANEIAADTITANEIAGHTITAAEIFAGTITATEIATNAITAVKINADAVTSEKIFAGAITSVKIATGAIIADKIDAGAVTSEKILAGAVTTLKLDAGAVTAEKIFAGAVTSEKILAGAVTAVKIDTGAVTADKIFAGAVTATKIDTGAVTSEKILAGAITAEKIGARVITADKLLIGIGQNRAINGGFEDGIAPHSPKAGAFYQATSYRRSGALAAYLECPNAGNVIFFNGEIADGRAKHLPVKNGDVVKAEIWVRNYPNRAAATVRIMGQIRDEATSTVLQSVSGTYTTVTGAYQKISIEMTVNHTDASFFFVYLNVQTGGTMFCMDDLEIANKVTGDLIVNGAIDGQTITGALIRSKASGSRVEMSDSGTYDDLRFYTGHAGETDPGQIGARATEEFGNYTSFRTLITAPGNTGLVGGYNPAIALGTTSDGNAYADISGGMDLNFHAEDLIRGLSNMFLFQSNNTGELLLHATDNGVAFGDKDGLGVLPNGRGLKGLNFGSVSASVNSAGRTSVWHGLRNTPSAVFFTSRNAKIYEVYSVSSTQIVIQAKDADTGNPAGNGTNAFLYWMAVE